VAVVATIAHPTADACIDGFVAGWKASTGAAPRIERHHGNGDAASLRNAMDTALRAQPDLVLALGSATIREACERGAAQPIVGAWCFDLKAACGDASSNELWGVETPPPTRQQTELLAALEPKPSRVGVVYAPTEAIATRQVTAARAFFAGSGIELLEQHVSEPSQVDAAIDALATSRVDAIWKLSDTTVARASKQLFERCAALRLPIVGDAEAQLVQGAIAVAFVDFRTAGERAARLAQRALDATPGEVPHCECFDEPRLLRNEVRLRELGITLR
jgi:putative ABC transport system substrate-binding protein